MRDPAWVHAMRSSSPGSSIVILLSGGLDSTTLLSIFKAKGYAIFPISFEYGQTHLRELKSVEDLCSYYGVKGKRVKVEIPESTSSLTGNAEIMARSLEEVGSGIPNTFVPSRNAIFLALAASYAFSIGVDRIAIGVNSVDYSGYPDCRPEFISRMEETINLALGKRDAIRIEAPLQYLSKGEIIRIGMANHAPYDLTWSCYRGDQVSCGKCDSCLLRLRGFMDAGLQDPLEYSEYPDFYLERKKKG